MKSLEKKTIPKLASEYECTACLACENICPKHAIAHFTDEDGHVYTRIDSDQCIGCLKCQNVCVASRNCVGVNDLSKSKIHAAWAQNVALRKVATSGGVFAALAETVINNGGCVIGAELCGFECKHVVIDRSGDIHRLQGSKYMSSSMEDVYRIISKELASRDVLFSGLGCQCAGVIAYFSDFQTNYHLYTVDLVCGGIPSRLLLDKFRTQHPEAVGIVSFRSKAHYVLKIVTNEGFKDLLGRNLPLDGFNCGLTNRYNCYNCQYACAHRKTDMTIGDLWDQSLYPQEHSKGVSMVITHTGAGEDLLRNAALECREIGWEGPLKANPRTFDGRTRVFYPRKRMVWLFEKLSEKSSASLYTMDIKPKQLLFYLFKIYRYLIQRYERARSRKLVDCLLIEAKKNLRQM